eukprot:INCI6855.1.p1 GENE.INCI6855.1~~INCI6855.1.p1  ORF type:complete len:177 (-),score=25.76 INCI6855.1:80-610(-)
MSWRMLSRQAVAAGRRSYFRGAASTRSWMPNAVGTGSSFDEQRQERSLAQEQQRSIHTTAKQDSTVVLLGGVAAAVGFIALHYAVEGVTAIQEKRSKGEPIFARSKYGMKFYEGGFEDEMTRREAALILGVRESADKKRVQKAYRRLLTLNHPDAGGSTFLATKINEAKDMLLGSQ